MPKVASVIVVALAATACKGSAPEATDFGAAKPVASAAASPVIDSGGVVIASAKPKVVPSAAAPALPTSAAMATTGGVVVPDTPASGHGDYFDTAGACPAGYTKVEKTCSRNCVTSNDCRGDSSTCGKPRSATRLVCFPND